MPEASEAAKKKTQTKNQPEKADPSAADGQVAWMEEWIASEEEGTAGESKTQRRWRQGQAAEPVGSDRETMDLGDLGELEELAQELEAESPSIDSPQTGADRLADSPIGDNEGTHISVEVDAEGHEAVVTALDLGKQLPRPGVEEVRQVLREDYGVVAGLDEDALRALLEQAQKQEIRKRVVVARWQPPEPGEDGRISFLYLAELEEDIFPAGELLRQALQRETLKAVLKDKLSTCLVTPGQLLAEVIPPTQGDAGQDIFGNPLHHPGEAVERPQAGENVAEEDEGYRAEIYGYACSIDHTLHVLSPIWLSPDRMRAAFVHFSQICKAQAVDSGWIVQLLEKAGVRHGIQEPAIEKLCRGTEKKTRRALLLARGEPARHGTDACFQPDFDMDPRPGRVGEDGSIDFHDRNIIVGVSEGQYLGTFAPATPGEDGMNVLGEELKATTGHDLSFAADEGVRQEDGEEGIRFYAEREGSVRKTESQISVLPVVAVNGDVDYEVGHVDTQADVQIQGSVRSGFHVRSRGNVVVGGRLENGGRIWADGSVGISQAIVGQDARVLAGGDLDCKFIQNSRVVVQGDIRVGSYILNSRVQAGGSIGVSAAGGKRAGCIIGGEVFAGKKIECSHLGSSGMEHTLVGCRPPPSIQTRIRAKRNEIAAKRGEIDAALANMGVTKLEKEQINTALARAPVPQRAHLMEAFKKAYQAVQDLPPLEEELAQLEEEGSAVVAAGAVVVTQNVYPEVIVEFGIRTCRIDDTAKARRYSLSDEGIAEDSL